MIFSAEKDASIIYKLGANWCEWRNYIHHPQPEEPEPEILPPVILTQYKKATQAGEEYSIEAEVAGTEPFTFRWFKDGRVFPQSKQQNLYLTDLKLQTPVATPCRLAIMPMLPMPAFLTSWSNPNWKLVYTRAYSPAGRAFKNFQVCAKTEIGSWLGATLEASIDESTPIPLLMMASVPTRSRKTVYTPPLPMHLMLPPLSFPYLPVPVVPSLPVSSAPSKPSSGHPTMLLPVLSFWIIKNISLRQTTPLPPPSKTNPYSSMS